MAKKGKDTLDKLGQGVGIVGDVVGLFGAIGSLFGGDEEEFSGLELPVEFEIKFLDRLEQFDAQIQDDMDKIDQIVADFDEAIAVEEAFIGGQIASEERIARMSATAMDLAESLGISAQELADQGFIGQEIRQSIEDTERRLRDIQGAGRIQDPQVEAKLRADKLALIDKLRREGVSPQGIEQALDEFERDAEVMRFQSSEQLRAAKFDRESRLGAFGLESRLTAQRQGFSIAESGLTRLRGELSRQDKLSARRTDLATARTAAETGRLGFRAKLRDEGMTQFERLGGFNLSDRTRDLLARGEIGPGSVEGQLSGRPGVGAKSGSGRLGPANQRFIEGSTLGHRTMNDIRGLDDQALVERLKRSQNFRSHAGQSNPANEEIRFIMREVERRGIT